jgi:hypothetical protein
MKAATMKALGRLALIAFLSMNGRAAIAHTSGASFLSLRVHDSESVTGTYDFDLRDLNQLLQLDRNLDGSLTWGEIEDATSAIEGLVIANTRLRAGGECSVTKREPLALAEHGDGPFARLTLTYRCTHVDSTLSIDQGAWFEFDPGQRVLLEYTDLSGHTTQTLLSRSSPRWRVAESVGARLHRFVIEGAFHLVTGYDHLAFLGVLLLALARRPKSQPAAPLNLMLKRALVVITAFTIAHSLTLALAATGKLLLPSKPVEVTIAASVFFAAVLNLWRGAGNHGWKLAFLFGLVHGLGFAGALAEMASDEIDLLALASFNLGIEAAQIGIAAVAVPLVWWIFRSVRNERFGLPAASLSVAALASFWVISRFSA